MPDNHIIAGLDRLWVLQPLVQPTRRWVLYSRAGRTCHNDAGLRVPGQHQAGDSPARTEVCQVWSNQYICMWIAKALEVNAHDTVTTNAGTLEDLHARHRVRVGWCHRVGLLAVQPGDIVALRKHSQLEAHMRVLQAAVLGADAAIGANGIGAEEFIVIMTRHDIGFSGDLWNPEAVDDIGGLERGMDDGAN